LFANYFFYMKARRDQQAIELRLRGLGCLSVMRLTPLFWFVILFCVLLPIMNSLSTNTGKLLR
jgi:hypothetical protein